MDMHGLRNSRLSSEAEGARRRALQEGVQLLIALEEDDLPQIFAICREIMRSTDEAQVESEANATAGAPAARARAGRAREGEKYIYIYI